MSPPNKTVQIHFFAVGMQWRSVHVHSSLVNSFSIAMPASHCRHRRRRQLRVGVFPIWMKWMRSEFVVVCLSVSFCVSFLFRSSSHSEFSCEGARCVRARVPLERETHFSWNYSWANEFCENVTGRNEKRTEGTMWCVSGLSRAHRLMKIACNFDRLSAADCRR